MRLERYLSRLVDTINSRHDLTIEEYELAHGVGGDASLIARLRFPDGSLLDLAEFVYEEQTSSGRYRICKASYRYHYQKVTGDVAFRYDDAPHHQTVSTFPHHKHVGNRVEAAEAPDLTDVLREIDVTVYGKQEEH